MNDTKIIKKILESQILNTYISIDSSLANLLTNLTKAPENWKELKNIYLTNEPSTKASDAVSIFEERLNFMLSERKTANTDYSETIKSTSKLVEYMKTYPNALMKTAIFNCDEFHYSIELGILNRKIDVVCVLKGGRIPENIFRGNP